jgi:hypothetical protein
MSDGIKVDSSKNTIWVPGSGNLPMVGLDQQRLDEKQKQHQRMSIHLRRQMLSTFQCTECKRKWSGKNVRIKWALQDGLKVELPVCPDLKCNAPVMIFRDALDLTKPLDEPRLNLLKTFYNFKFMRPCTASTFDRFLTQEFTKGGLGAQVEIGHEVQCPHCPECVVLREDGKWEVVK